MGRILPAVILVIAGLLIYAPSLDASFVYDDHVAILGNDHVRPRSQGLEVTRAKSSRNLKVGSIN